MLFRSAFSVFPKSAKGAMFGMDARVALAIMGSLAALVGFYAFNRFKAAESVAVWKELRVIDESLQGYQSDMATFIPFTISGGSDGTKDFNALIDVSNVSTGFQKYWNGPYIDVESNDHTTYGAFTIGYGQLDRTTACTTTSPCYAWITLSNVPAVVWEKLNTNIDENGGDDPETSGSEHTSGRLHGSSGSADPRTLYYRSVKRP